jgi:hypothetical protein
MPTKVFLSAASKTLKLQISGTGDIDYANTLSESFCAAGQNAEFVNMQSNSQNDIYSHIWQTSKQEAVSPILHILINSPDLGNAFTRRDIKNFKQQGGKVMCTHYAYRIQPTIISLKLLYIA